MHDDLKQRLRDEVDAGLGTRPPSDLSDALRRGRGKRLALRLMTTMSMILVGTTVVAGGLWISQTLDAAPVRPAEEGKQEIEPMRNGRIVQADDGFLPNGTAPSQPGGDKSYFWDAFDQRSGSFLYAVGSRGPFAVVGENGPVAEFYCPPSSDCVQNESGGIVVFGPGPDEITVPSADTRFVHLIGFDGTLRSTLDISAASVSPGQSLSGLAWSHDGNRLAVSTDCDASGGRCGGRVWILDRDSGEAQLVYRGYAITPSDSARRTEYGAVRNLAWSPDGNTLALLVSPPGFCEFPKKAPPQLVALRVAADGSVSAETLFVYGDDDEAGCIRKQQLRLEFPFAWSPDATRIAVEFGYGVAEISAQNGELLARHPDEDSDGPLDDGADGPLAWLPERGPNP